MPSLGRSLIAASDPRTNIDRIAEREPTAEESCAARIERINAVLPANRAAEFFNKDIQLADYRTTRVDRESCRVIADGN